jgi:hypothetical protein
MISKEEFWNIMESYGTNIWPMQIVLYFIALLLVGWLIVKPGYIQNIVTKIFLSITFAWNGIFFYLLFAKGMAGSSYGNYFLGFLFLFISLLFMVDVFRQKMNFAFSKEGWPNLVVLILMILVFFYPLFGILSGHDKTSLIMPGTFPCPTAAFGILLLINSLPKVDKIIFIALLFCAIPFTPFMQIAKYGVYEDTILFATGIFGVFMLVKYWRNEKLQNVV